MTTVTRIATSRGSIPGTVGTAAFGDIYLDAIRVVKQTFGNQCFLPIVLEEWRFFHVGMQD